MLYRKLGLYGLIWLSQFVAGCGSNAFTGGFEKELVLRHKPVGGELLISSISGLFVLDCLVVVMNPSQGTADNSLFTFIDPFRNKILGKGGVLGRGPGELLWVKNLACLSDTDKVFEVFDNIGGSLARYSLRHNGDSIGLHLDKKIPVPAELSGSFINRVVKQGDNYIALTLKGKGEYYALLDKGFNFIRSFGNPPISGNATNYYQRLQGVMSNAGDSFAYIPFDIPKVQYYSVKDTVVTLEWEDTFAEPYYEIHGETLRFDKEKTTGHTTGVCMDGKYLYLVWWPGKYGDFGKSGGWSDADCSDIIFVYSRKGERIAKLRLDKKIFSIYVSRKHNKVYGIAIDPYFSVVAFDLPDELKG